MATYLSQGIDYLGFLAAKLRDLHGYATLAHELVQNAGDAQAGQMSFDIRRFRNIAGGDKRQQDGTTGAFGIGFIAVYHITDRPERVSGNRQ